MTAPDHAAILQLIAQKNSAPLDLPERATALIVVDLQRAFVEPDGRFLRLMSVLAAGAIDEYRRRIGGQVVPNAQRLIGAFRSAGLPVAFTGMGTRAGDGSDLPPSLRGFDEVARQVIGGPVWPGIDDSDWTLDESLPSRDGEILVQKTTTDPFVSTDLAEQLRAKQVSTVVVCGLTTDVCVASTARGAADRGFEAVIAEDACTTLSEHLHRASLDVIGLAFGRLATTSDIVASLRVRAERPPQHMPAA